MTCCWGGGRDTERERERDGRITPDSSLREKSLLPNVKRTPEAFLAFWPTVNTEPLPCQRTFSLCRKKVAEEKQVGRRRAEQWTAAAQRAARLDTLLPAAADTSLCAVTRVYLQKRGWLHYTPAALKTLALTWLHYTITTLSSHGLRASRHLHFSAGRHKKKYLFFVLQWTSAGAKMIKFFKSMTPFKSTWGNCFELWSITWCHCYWIIKH